MVRPLDSIEPNGKNQSLYAEEYVIYKETFEALLKSGIFEKIAGFQRKHWG
jgi:hypothetical protein